MDWMYSNCSVTAQHGALKWRPIFGKANLPVFEKLYKSVKTGKETARSHPRLRRQGLPEVPGKKLAEIHESEMWRAGAAVRALRPKEKAKEIVKGVKGTGGRGEN